MIVNMTGFIFFAGLLSYFQIRQILANEGKKAAVVYGCLMGLATFIGLLLIAGVDIPSQNIIITRIFTPIGKTLLGNNL